MTTLQSDEHVEGNQRSLFGIIRAFKEICGLGSQRKQAGQRHFELAFGVMAVLTLIGFALPLAWWNQTND